MRWGVRKGRGGTTVGKTATKTESGERQKTRTVYSKSPKKLTNAEMERRIKRMEMEKRYNDLNSRDVSQGEKIARELVTNVGKQVVTNVATRALTNVSLIGLDKALTKKVGEDAASLITYGKKKQKDKK